MSPIADYAVPAVFAIASVVHMAIHRSETPPPPYSDRERAPTNSGRAITSRSDESHRSTLKRIAEETLTAIREGSYPYKGVDKDLTEAVKEAKSKTVYYPSLIIYQAVGIFYQTQPYPFIAYTHFHPPYNHPRCCSASRQCLQEQSI